MTIEATTLSNDSGGQEPVYAEPGQLSTDPDIRDNPYLAIRYAITYQVAVTQEESDGFPESAPWEELISRWQNSQAGPPEIVSGTVRYHSEWNRSFGDAESARQYEPSADEIDWDDAADAAREARVYPSPTDNKPTVDTAHLLDDFQDVLRRMKMIGEGAWQHPAMDVMIKPSELMVMANSILTVARCLAEAAALDTPA